MGRKVKPSTEHRHNEMGVQPERRSAPLSQYPKPNKTLKKEINDNLIREVLRNDNVVGLLHNWLRTIHGRYDTTSGIPLIRKEQLKNDLVKGLMLLNSDLQDVKASPYLSDEELEGLDVTPELGKFKQLKKDEWMNDYINGDISKWLLDDKIIYALQKTSNTSSIEPVIVDTPQSEDVWIDIGTLYEEYSGKTRSPIGVEINIGKIRGGKRLMLDVLKQIHIGTKGGIGKALSLLMRSGIFIPLRVGGHVIKISTDIVLTSLLSIIKSIKPTDMFFNALYGLFGPAFNISEDPKSVREGLDTKYKVLLAQTFQKTLFTLSRIVNPSDIVSANIEDKLTEGSRVLNEYVTGHFSDFSGQKIEITNVMFSLDKLIEWYLMRRTIVVYNPKSNTLLLEDVPLTEGTRGELSTGAIDIEMGRDDEPEDESGLLLRKKKKKKTKKNKKTKKTKNKKKTSKIRRKRVK
jgi:hypothetical protein